MQKKIETKNFLRFFSYFSAALSTFSDSRSFLGGLTRKCVKYSRFLTEIPGTYHRIHSRYFVPKTYNVFPILVTKTYSSFIALAHQALAHPLKKKFRLRSWMYFCDRLIDSVYLDVVSIFFVCVFCVFCAIVSIF